MCTRSPCPFAHPNPFSTWHFALALTQHFCCLFRMRYPISLALIFQSFVCAFRRGCCYCCCYRYHLQFFFFLFNILLQLQLLRKYSFMLCYMYLFDYNSVCMHFHSHTYSYVLAGNKHQHLYYMQIIMKVVVASNKMQ